MSSHARIILVTEIHALLQLSRSEASNQIADFWTSNLSACNGTVRKDRLFYELPTATW